MCDCHDDAKLTRRALVAGVGTFLAAGMLPRRSARAEDKAPPPNAISPADALERLKVGNDRYKSGGAKDRDFSVERAARAIAQHPIAGILACADSRVPPEIIFDQGPGDLFVSRDAGNVVSNYGLASFEYAVTSLGIPLILVLGHSGCGAVLTALSASMQRKELPGHLPELVKAIQPAVITAHGKHPGDYLAASIEENVRLGMKRLKTQSDIIGEAVAAGKLKIAGGVYDLETGVVNLV
jgi:carbonic anhydrase